jgi:kynurenine aminotransferase
MWERTVTVGSGGSKLRSCNNLVSLFNVLRQESFAATGWRIGWLIGPSSLIGPTLAATTRIVFSSNSPMQEAVATGLEKVKHNDFFEKQRLEYQERRDILVTTFKKLGMQYTFPEGSYFLLVVSRR